MMTFWRWGSRREKRGRPGSGDIDCAGVVEQLYEFIDEELTDSELVEKIRKHLEICQKCYPHYEFEKAFLRFLAEQGRSEAPPELRRRIFERILSEESGG